MLGDRRLAQSERLHQLRYVRVSRRKTSEDCSSCGICKRAEGQAKRVGLLVNLHMAILPDGDIQVKSYQESCRRRHRCTDALGVHDGLAPGFSTADNETDWQMALANSQLKSSVSSSRGSRS